MAIAAAKLYVEIGADTSQAQKALTGFSSRLNDFSRATAKIGGILSVGITAPAVMAGKALFSLGANMEQSNVAFTQMLGSGERANKFLSELRDFASKTPFDFTGLQDASRRLLAMGFAAQDILPMMRDIGDAVSGLGLGADGIDRVTLALGQMRAKSKVSAQEMMQLTETGIPAWEYLARAIGKSVPEVMKLAEKGLIPADEAIQSILAGMRQDFGGMMAEQSKTATGQLSNLRDELEALGVDLSQFILPAAKEFISIARDLAQQFNALPDGTKKTVVELVALAAATGPALTGISALARGISGVASLTKGAITAVRGITTGFKAWQAGMSLTTSLGAAGLSSVAISLGAVALAAGAVVGVWAQWNKQISETNKRGVQAVKSTWADFFDKQIQSGKSATNVLKEYQAAQARIADGLKIDWSQVSPAAMISGKGWSEIGKLFIDRKGMLQAGVEELSNALMRASTSYTEYVNAMTQAGLQTKIVAEEQFTAMKTSLDATSVAAQQTEASLTSMAVTSTDQIEQISGAAKRVLDSYNSLIAKQDELKSKMDAWVSETASQVAQALGQRMSESSNKFRNAIAEVDAIMGTNYLQQLQLKDSVNALVNEYARTGNLDKFREGLNKIKEEGLANMKSELESVTIKAQALYDKLLSLPQEIRIKIGFDVEELRLPGGTTEHKVIKPSVQARASGGSVNAGQLYVVGERGPELFIPRQSGTIVPNFAKATEREKTIIQSNYYLTIHEASDRVNILNDFALLKAMSR